MQLFMRFPIHNKNSKLGSFWHTAEFSQSARNSAAMLQGARSQLDMQRLSAPTTGPLDDVAFMRNAFLWICKSHAISFMKLAYLSCWESISDSMNKHALSLSWDGGVLSMSPVLHSPTLWFAVQHDSNFYRWMLSSTGSVSHNPCIGCKRIIPAV